MTALKLIVGLGNPGPEYIETRHNAGFWFIDEIATTPLSYQSKFKGLVGEMIQDGRKIYLLKPETYMNKSGESVLALAHFYKILPEEILVVHDELDLPPGIVKLKQGGGHGGHNGLKSIASCLGSNNFNRLRIGVGHPGDAKLVANYVLKKASGADQKLMDDSIWDARRYLSSMVSGDFEPVMNELHRKK